MFVFANDVAAGRREGEKTSPKFNFTYDNNTLLSVCYKIIACWYTEVAPRGSQLSGNFIPGMSVRFHIPKSKQTQNKHYTP